MISAPSGQSLLSGITDSSGQYTFQNVETGSYSAQVTASGYSSGTGSATVQSGQTAEVTILLARASPPQAAFTYTPLQVYGGMTVTFDASSSSAGGPNTTITQYEWTISDPNNPVHTIRSSPTIAHAFSTSGTYVVQLNVTNSVGLWSTTSKPVVVARARNPYDLNGDCHVDIQDIAIAASAFGTVPGDSRWNPIADIIGPGGIPDGEVDILDIAWIAKHFGDPASASATGQSAAPQPQFAPPYLSIDGGYVIGPSAVIGQTFNVTVSLNNVTKGVQHLIAIEYRLQYNNTLIQPVAVTEGPFFKQFADLENAAGYPPAGYPPGTWITSYINDPDGVLGPNVLVGQMIFPNAMGLWNEPLPNGTGVIVTITFQVIAQPSGTESITTPLILADAYAIGLDSMASQNLGFVSLGPSVNGNLTITAGATHTVFFEESGVGNPAQVWSVALDGYGTEFSNGSGNTISTIIFTGVANGGPYQFIVTPPSGFVAQPTADPITVDGGDFHQPITFTSVPVTYTFTLTAGSGGSVSYSFSLGSGTVLSGQYQQLTVPQSCQFSLTANPDSTFILQNWLPTGAVSVSNPYTASTTATVNGDGSLTANFAYKRVLRIASGTGGSVSYSSSYGSGTVSSGQSANFQVPSSAQVSLTANPESLHVFQTWSTSGSVSVSDPYTASTTATVNGDGGVTAGFATFQLQVSPQSETVPITEIANFAVSIVPIDNFNQKVTVSISGLPSSMTPSTPIDLAPGEKGTCIIFVDKTASTGTYNPVINAVSGSITESVKLSLIVTRVIGVKNKVTISSINGQSDISGLSWLHLIVPISAREVNIFTIQQNFWIFTPGQNLQFPVYWVQNVLLALVWTTNVLGRHEIDVAQMYNVWTVDPTTGLASKIVSSSGLFDPLKFHIPALGLPSSFTLTSELTSTPTGTNLILESDYSTFSVTSADLPLLSSEAYIVNYPGAVSGWNYKYIPQLDIVSVPNLLVVNSYMAFSSPTSGSVDTFEKLEGLGWSSSVSISSIVDGSSSTGETSSGLSFTSIAAESNSASFDWTGGADQGLGFHCSTISSQQEITSTILESGKASTVQTISGIMVGITGSSAPDATPVSIATTALSGVLAGIVQVGTTPAAYYDVNVQGISDGTATICITNSDVLGQTTMQYLNGAQWVIATDVVVSGNTICGDIPVSALSGTPIAIGPLNSCTITFDQLGVDSDFNGTLLVVDGTPYDASQLPVSFIWPAVSVHTFAFQSPLTVTANVEQYVWTGTAGLSSAQSSSINTTTSGSIVGDYELQYNVAISQTGAGSDFNGTVATIDGTNYTASDLPTSFLWDNGSTHNFAFQSPLLGGSGAKEYDWASTSGLSTLQSDSITTTGPGNVTGNYVTLVHDVAVTSVTADRAWVYQGFSANVNVTVMNKGDFTENVTVALYYNITANDAVGTQNVTLTPGQNQTIIFVWNTTGVPYCLNYTMTGIASIPADNNPTDNTLAGGTIKVRILGDINGEDKVNIGDVAIAAKAFGSRFGWSRWNPDADVNGDGRIDIQDIALIAKNFGKHYP
jgi:hypothetical protein